MAHVGVRGRVECVWKNKQMHLLPQLLPREYLHLERLGVLLHSEVVDQVQDLAS